MCICVSVCNCDWDFAFLFSNKLVLLMDLRLCIIMQFVNNQYSFFFFSSCFPVKIYKHSLNEIDSFSSKLQIVFREYQVLN